MKSVRLPICVWAVLLLLAPAFAQQASTAKPKVRAITAFIRIDRNNYLEQVQDTLTMLRNAKAAVERSGYEVQSIRITTQPFPEYTKGLSIDEAVSFLRDYDALAAKEGFDASLGPAMVNDGDDPMSAEVLAHVLAQAKAVEGSIVVAGNDGIHWKAVAAAARLIKYVEANSKNSQGNFNFTASAFVPQDAPFFPASYHLGPGHQFAIGLQSANVVAEVFATNHDASTATAALASALGKHARAIETVAKQIENNSGWTYMGIDLSPAPLKEVSIGQAIENFTGTKIGSSGTLTATAIITNALKLVPVRHAGYSGLMLPVLEDTLLAQRWSEGALRIDDLLAYSAVCGTGLDTIPLPGDITEAQLGRIITDMASLAAKWHKPLSARLLPVSGKAAGQRTEFDDPFLVNAVI
ncbi:MAG: DUF711 family protein [Acidobacteria bacterium]|nr:DUF711 family protein [Acidobacteriota bacterium]